jgi:hypothetical protein
MNYQEQYNKLITTRKNLLRKKGEGIKKSPEHLQKLNDIFFSKPKIQCHHCNKHVDYRNFSRWHGDNCIKIKERIK